MKKLLSILAMALVVAIALAGPAMAKRNSGPAELKMGTGGLTGNYYSMGTDVADYCGEAIAPDATITVLESDAGSVTNILGLDSKTLSLGIMQEDVLQYYAKQNGSKFNKNRMKIVSGMHSETMYLLIPRGFKPKGGAAPEAKGWFSKIWSDDDDNKAEKVQAVKLSLQALSGQKLGAWGGSVVSAKALQYFTQVDFEIVNVPKAQRDSVTMPLLLVGGQPYAPVEKYLKTGRYTLVSIDPAPLQARAPFYMPTSTSYTVNGQVISVNTVAVRAHLVGKAFRTKKRNEPMVKLAQCIYDSLYDLADDPNTNSNWQSVADFELGDDNTMINWGYFKVARTEED